MELSVGQLAKHPDITNYGSSGVNERYGLISPVDDAPFCAIRN
jgi:hypothetical protein